MQGLDIINREKVYKNLYTTDDDIFISKSPFSAFENKEDEELVYRGRTSPISMEHIMMNVKSGFVKLEGDGIDLEVLKALNELGYATSRMVTIYLNLLGIDAKQEKVHKRLRYLNRIKILSSYEFQSKDEDGNIKKSHVPVYFLDKGGVTILNSWEIPCYWDIGDTIRPKHGIKEILARNQLMLTYLVRIKNIEYTKIQPMYRLPNNEKFYPDLQIVFNSNNGLQHLFFEIVRTFNGWKSKLIRRLEQYKLFYENFAPSKTIPNVPILIIVSENDPHSYNILKVIAQNQLIIPQIEYLFTTDTRVISSEINRSIVKFEPNDDEISIIVLNFSLFDTMG